MHRTSLKIATFVMVTLILFNPYVFFLSLMSDSNLTEINRLRISNTNPKINLPEIDYISLNQTWYDPPIEMLIIAPNQSDFVDVLQPYAEWKNQKGVKTVILTNFCLYPGIDNAEKIRNMIKSYYDSDHIRWVLLAGDAEDDLIPIRYVYNPDVVVVPGNAEYSNFDAYYKPTDFYYAALDSNWNQDGDSNWGENPDNNANDIDEINWIPDVYVGRLPADNAVELSNMVNKTLKYEMNPENGDWMNHILLAAGVSSDTFDEHEDEARLSEYIWQNYVINEMNFTHLTQTTGSFTPATPPVPNQKGDLTHTNFVNAFNDSSVVFFAGHADPTQFTDASVYGPFYTRDDASSSNNVNKPSLVYADACTTSPYDVQGSVGDNNIGENLINQPNAGAIGFIGGIRVTWYLPNDTELEKLNRGNAKLFFKEFFEEKEFQQGRALYDSKVSYMNSNYFKRGDTSMALEWQRKNILAYNLLGDPEVDIYTGIPTSVPNYFQGDVYEGQLVSFTLKDNFNRIVPYGRVHLTSSDGKYRTVYADINGKVEFRLPPQSNETYNVTITGHNLIPSSFNFTTKEDTDLPELINYECNPHSVTVNDNLCFNFITQDNHSGIESIFIALTKNNFQDYTLFRVGNSFNENFKDFNITLNKLKPGDYSYAFLVRDYANATLLYIDSSFQFKIEIPMSYYIIIISLITIVGIISFSIFFTIFKLKNFNQWDRKNASNPFH
jgi:hypothetical protein